MLKIIYYKIQYIYLFFFFKYRIRVNCKKKFIGNKYGGFIINPEIINNKSIIFSFGIGKDISFDLELIKIYNCTVYAFDPTPDSSSWINSQILPVNFKFHSFGIGVDDSYSNFYLPINKNFISGSVLKSKHLLNEPIIVELKSLESISNMINIFEIDILKIDIEGLEFKILQNLPKDILIKQIIVEFHNRNSFFGNLKARQTIKKLYNDGFRIFAISETNTELSFINKVII